jgi:hypothetical protein
VRIPAAITKNSDIRGDESMKGESAVKKERKGLMAMKGVFTRFVMPLVIACFLGASPAFGAHPLITDDTGTQGKGKTQIELTGQFDRDDEGGARTEGWEAKAVLTYGLLDPLDLVLEVPYTWISAKDGETVREDGFSDLLVALKWRFFEQGGLSLAVKPAVTLATGDDEKGLGNGRASYGVNLISTYARDPWAFHVNLGVTHNDYKLEADREANRDDIWNASLAAEYKLGESWKIVANVGAERNADVTSDTPPAFLLGGVIWSVSETLDIDAGVKWGLNGPETDLSFLAGVTFRF